jgi:hypothetical protein
MPLSRQSVTALAVLLISGSTMIILQGCDQQPSQDKQVPKTTELKPGVPFNTQPADSEQLLKQRSELIKLIKEKKISVDEAKNYFMIQKERLDLPNPDSTKGFDAMLKQAGVR